MSKQKLLYESGLSPYKQINFKLFKIITLAEKHTNHKNTSAEVATTSDSIDCEVKFEILVCKSDSPSTIWNKHVWNQKAKRTTLDASANNTG